MTNDPLDRLGEEPLGVPEYRVEPASTLRHRLELQRQVTAVAAGTTTLIPYLAVRDATRAIEFYQSVFGAQLAAEPFRADDGRISHAALTIGDVTIYLSDEFPEMNVAGPAADAGFAVSLVIHVPDADLCLAAAEASGGVVQQPAQDQWDFRSGWFIDPFGHRWSPTSAAHHVPQGALS